MNQQGTCYNQNDVARPKGADLSITVLVKSERWASNKHQASGSGHGHHRRRNQRRN
jgi:hypothetical protein